MTENYEPTGRRGACSISKDNSVYVLRGHEDRLSADTGNSLYKFSLQEGRWDISETRNGLSSMVSGSCCCALGDHSLATFGGWEAGRRVADMYVFKFKELEWVKCKIKNPAKGPFLKDKAGMVPYGDRMVCVVGGYGDPSTHHLSDGVYHGQEGAQYHWDWQSGLCWTNEVHLFCFDSEEWITPQISGQAPPPCAAFTLTMADSFRAVFFGGRQVRRRVNNLYILRLDIWHWEGVFLKSFPDELWPSERSFHTMCSLVEESSVACVSDYIKSTTTPSLSRKRFDWLPCAPPDLTPVHPNPALRPRLLLLWGMDNGGDPVSDCWTLELDPITWKKVSIPSDRLCQPRLWHVAAAWHPTPSEAQVVVFGGTKSNLYDESSYTVRDTIVFTCGVPTLYSLCVMHLTQLPEAAIIHLNFVLPALIVEKIVQQAAARKLSHHFPYIKL